MHPLQTFDIDVRPSAEPQVSKPPCKGLCEKCKRAANTALEAAQTNVKATNFANNKD